MSGTARRARYTSEFKMESVRQALASGLSINTAAEQLGIPTATLGSWIRLHHRGKLSERAAKAPVVTAEQMEISRLRAEVAQLRMERDIAKKAAAYFAQDLLQSTPGYKK